LIKPGKTLDGSKNIKTTMLKVSKINHILFIIKHMQISR